MRCPKCYYYLYINERDKHPLMILENGIWKCECGYTLIDKWLKCRKYINMQQEKKYLKMLSTYTLVKME